MKPILDELEQEHIYICLKEGEKSFLKARKSSESLGLSTKPIDDALEVNKHLRLIFNPRAEEEARESARKSRGDPTQMDIERDGIASSGETGGRGRVAGSIAHAPDIEEIPPTDTVIRDNLAACGIMVLLTDVRQWTSSERESVVTFSRAYDRFDVSDLMVPDCLEKVAIGERRMAQMVAAGPFKIRAFPVGAPEPTSTLIYLPGSPGESEIIEGEYVDGSEAEIKCAIMNRDLIRNLPIHQDMMAAWLAAGPWSAVLIVIGVDGETKSERWYVMGDGDSIVEKELVASVADARRIAAIYNRDAAGRDETGAWKSPPPPLALSKDRENNEGDLRSPDGAASSVGTEGVGG